MREGGGGDLEQTLRERQEEKRRRIKRTLSSLSIHDSRRTPVLVLEGEEAEERLQLRRGANHGVGNEVKEFRDPQKEQFEASALARVPSQTHTVDGESVSEEESLRSREEERERLRVRHRAHGESPEGGEDDEAEQLGEQSENRQLVEKRLVLPREERGVEHADHTQQFYPSRTLR